MVARSGVYRACIVIIGALLLTGGSVSRAAADDAKICAEESGDVAIAACTRAIKSGKYRGHQLAIKFLNRGVEWKLKKEYDRAMADYAEAVRLDANYADAFYDRCIIDNIKEDYDRALSECSRAIKIGASADALAATGGVHLGIDRATSDYYAQRGYSYLSKKDYDHAIADFDDAIRLYSKNARTVYNRGLAYQAKGDTTRADTDFDTAKELDKK
jgi:tetratricopeptide (TPR) repeat protein